MRLLSLFTTCLLPLLAVAQGAETPLRGFEGTALCTAVSPDGKLVAVGAQDGTVAFWDATRRETQILTGHAGPVLAVALGPKGDWIASVSADKTLRVWNTVDGKEKIPPLKIGTVDGKEKIPPLKIEKGKDDPGDVLTCVAVSNDGKWAAVSGWDGKIRLLDLTQSKKEDKKAEKEEPKKEKAEPKKDGPKKEETEAVVPAEQGPIFSLALSPDGKWLASGGRNGTVKIWNVAGMKLHATLAGHERTVWSAAWTTDGNLLAASAGNDVKVWNVADQKVVAELKGHTAAVRSVAFTAGDKKLVTGSEDKSVHIWDLPEKLPHGDGVIDHFQQMSAATQLRGKEEDERQGRPLYEKGYVSPVEWNALAAEIKRLKELASKSKEFHQLTDGIVYSAAASADGKLVVAATKSPTLSVRVWRLTKD